MDELMELMVELSLVDLELVAEVELFREAQLLQS